MIANFRFEHRPEGSCIAVRLRWAEGKRTGSIEMPVDLAEDVADFEWPAPEAPMSIDGALAYAIFLSMRCGRSLRLTGDATVWEDSWGCILRNN